MVEANASMATATGEPSPSVPAGNLPWQAIPEFVPGSTDVEDYVARLKFLAKMWPAQHFPMLVTTAATKVRGTAFEKIMLAGDKLSLGNQEALESLVSLLGGDWGKIEVEDKFAFAERALYQTTQLPDESADSYLTRQDVVWTKLLAKGTTLPELQAYVLLRQSRLESSDRKKLIIDGKGQFKMEDIK